MRSSDIPTLSLIVPVYGVEDYVGDCLDSILGAPGFADHCELIIVDDGSTDRSMEVVERRCHGVANVTIVRQANAGLGAARNTGMMHACGHYLWFVDSDDEVCADAIITLVDCIEQFHPDVIAFEFETIGGSLNRGAYLPVYDQIVDPLQFILSGRPPSPVQFYVFSRALISSAGLTFVPGIYHEDALFTPSTIMRAASLVRLRTACYRYRLRSGSIMSVSRPLKHFEDMLFIAESFSVRAKQTVKNSTLRKALAREVGFALAAARYYAARTGRREGQVLIPFRRLATIGLVWWRYFPPRVFVNYVRLLGFVAWRNSLGVFRK